MWGLCYADKKKNNNINNTATITSLLSSALQCFPHRGWALRCLSWMGAKYSATLLKIRSGYVVLRGEDLSNSLNTIYIIIFFLLGMGICLYLPFLFYSMTDLNTYNNSSITDAAYSRSFFEISKSCCCARMFFYICLFILVYLLKLNID